MADATLTERVVSRERVIVAAGLVIIAALAWWYLLTGADTGMSPLAMSTWQFPPPVREAASAARWSPAYGLVMLAMWWVMMIAMMLPSAAPAILLYTRVFRHGQRREGSATAPAAAFTTGYLASWLGFSALATGLQLALEQSALLDGAMMWATSRWLTVALLVAAGLYQLSPLKGMCLSLCRSPARWLAHHWRPGRMGAFRMGLEHGVTCVGCCWALMLLLFAGGIMNLVWIAGLSILVLAEKLAPAEARIGEITAALLLAAGTWIALGPWAAS